MGLVVCHCSMFNSFGNHVHLASIQSYRAITHFDFKRAFENKEEVVCVRVRVPNELAFDFDDHEIVIVESADSSWVPVFVERAELFREIYCVVRHIGT